MERDSQSMPAVCIFILGLFALLDILIDNGAKAFINDNIAGICGVTGYAANAIRVELMAQYPLFQVEEFCLVL